MVFFENSVKIRYRVNADGTCDFQDAVLCLSEHTLGLTDTDKIQIFGEGCSCGVLENSAKITGVKSEMSGNAVEVDVLSEMFIDVGEGGEDFLHFLTLVKFQTVGEIAVAIE